MAFYCQIYSDDTAFLRRHIKFFHLSRLNNSSSSHLVSSYWSLSRITLFFGETCSYAQVYLIDNFSVPCLQRTDRFLWMFQVLYLLISSKYQRQIQLFILIRDEHYLEIILRLLGIRRWWHLGFYLDCQRLFWRRRGSGSRAAATVTIATSF